MHTGPKPHNDGGTTGTTMNPPISTRSPAPEHNRIARFRYRQRGLLVILTVASACLIVGCSDSTTGSGAKGDLEFRKFDASPPPGTEWRVDVAVKDHVMVELEGAAAEQWFKRIVSAGEHLRGEEAWEAIAEVTATHEHGSKDPRHFFPYTPNSAGTADVRLIVGTFAPDDRFTAEQHITYMQNGHSVVIRWSDSVAEFLSGDGKVDVRHTPLTPGEIHESAQRAAGEP